MRPKNYLNVRRLDLLSGFITGAVLTTITGGFSVVGVAAPLLPGQRRCWLRHNRRYGRRRVTVA